MKKSFLLAVLFVFMSSVLIGSLQADDKILRLITWTGYAPPELIAKFEKETGIKVEVTYSNNEEIMSKLRPLAGVDLIWPSRVRIEFQPYKNSLKFIRPLIIQS